MTHPHWPCDAGPYLFVWVDALVIRVREHGRTINVHALVAVGVNADGGREVLGVEVTSDEDGAGWLATTIRTIFDQPDTDAVQAHMPGPASHTAPANATAELGGEALRSAHGDAGKHVSKQNGPSP
jgi:hypothetical protein